jgi:carboxymethylenebutenolidase
MFTIDKLKVRVLTALLVIIAWAGSAPGFLWSGDGKIAVKEVSYIEGQEDVKGYLAYPDDGKKHPAIVLIHEWWGLTDWIKENARKFAEQGYVALAVDLYNGQVTDKPAKARELATAVRNDMDGAFKNLKMALGYLKGLSNHVIKDRMASVGWCFGGGWSYQVAKNNLGTKASIIYYGRFNPKDDLSKMRAVILGNFGENDRGIRVDNVKEFQAMLKTLSGNHEVYIYENAGHGFARPGGRSYNKEAAELSWKRTLAFLKKYL